MSAITCPEMHITLTWPSVGGPTPTKPLLLPPLPFLPPPFLSARRPLNPPKLRRPNQSPSAPCVWQRRTIVGWRQTGKNNEVLKIYNVDSHSYITWHAPYCPSYIKNGDEDCFFFFFLPFPFFAQLSAFCVFLNNSRITPWGVSLAYVRWIVKEWWCSREENEEEQSEGWLWCPPPPPPPPLPPPLPPSSGGVRHRRPSHHRLVGLNTPSTQTGYTRGGNRLTFLRLFCPI